MKLPALLVAGSLAANLALLALYLRRSEPSPISPSVASAVFTSPSSPSRSPSLQPTAVASTTWAALDTPDLDQLVARLRATGFSPAVIRAIIQARVQENFTRAYYDFLPPEPEFQFWKSNRELFRKYNKEVHLWVSDFWARQNPVTEDLIATVSAEDAAAHAAKLLRDYGDIPRGKIDRIRRIDADYNARRLEVEDAADGIMLPEDRAQLAALDRERLDAPAAPLTPAELASHRLATAHIPFGMRRAFNVMNATEAEFLRIAPYLTTFNRHTNRSEPPAAPTVDQLKSALGETRYAEFVLASDPDFQRVTHFTREFDLPAATPHEALAVRGRAAEESHRIANHSALGPEQQRAALVALARDTRARLNALLGPAAGPAFDNYTPRWLGELKRGNAISFASGELMLRPLPWPAKPKP